MRTGAPVQWEYLLVLPSNSSRRFERRVYGSNVAEFVNSKYHQKFLSNHHHFYAKSPFSQNLPSLPTFPISRITNLAHLYNMAQVRLTLAQSYFSRNPGLILVGHKPPGFYLVGRGPPGQGGPHRHAGSVLDSS